MPQDDFNKYIYTRIGLGICLVSAIVTVLILNLIIGCASMGVKPISEMSPKERGLFFLQVYNDQYEDYLAVVESPNLTAEQKQILKKKKEILTAVYPMIKLYLSYIESGGVPDQETEKQIIEFIDELLLIQIE